MFPCVFFPFIQERFFKATICFGSAFLYSLGIYDSLLYLSFNPFLFSPTSGSDFPNRQAQSFGRFFPSFFILFFGHPDNSILSQQMTIDRVPPTPPFPFHPTVVPGRPRRAFSFPSSLAD